MTQLSTSMRRSGLARLPASRPLPPAPVVVALLPPLLCASRARFHVAMAPGKQQNPVMLYLCAQDPRGQGVGAGAHVDVPCARTAVHTCMHACVVLHGGPHDHPQAHLPYEAASVEPVLLQLSPVTCSACGSARPAPAAASRPRLLAVVHALAARVCTHSACRRRSSHGSGTQRSACTRVLL
jgi:hypothetical protein